MPKNKKNRAERSGPRPSESLAMHALVSGCFAELFLFIVRRFSNGMASQVVLWNERYFPILVGVGVAILALGAIWTGLQRGDRLKRLIGLYMIAAGAFVAFVSLLGIWNLSAIDRLIVIVPLAALLGIVWNLYDRVCAVSLSSLTLGAVSTWIFSHTMQPYSTHIGLSRVAAVVLLAALAAVLFLLWNGTLKKVLSLKGDPFLLYVSLALAFAGILASLVSVGAAGWATGILTLAAFGLIVYYSVKQI